MRPPETPVSPLSISKSVSVALGCFILGSVAESGAAASGSGRAGVRQTYRRHEVLITRISGVIFIGFAVNALAHAAAGFAGRPA